MSAFHAPRASTFVAWRLRCFFLATLVSSSAALVGCSRTTARLAPELQQRLQSEGIVRQADDVGFRFTHGIGTRNSGWEDMLASIIVTRRTILIHRNDQFQLEVTPDHAEGCRVRRDHDRLSIHVETGRSKRSWSFRPSDDAEGWARDLRAAMKGGAPGDTSGE